MTTKWIGKLIPGAKWEFPGEDITKSQSHEFNHIMHHSCEIDTVVNWKFIWIFILNIWWPEKKAWEIECNVQTVNHFYRSLSVKEYLPDWPSIHRCIKFLSTHANRQGVGMSFTLCVFVRLRISQLRIKLCCLRRRILHGGSSVSEAGNLPFLWTLFPKKPKIRRICECAGHIHRM